MKKILMGFLVIMLVLLSGCGEKNEESESAMYVVVKMPEDLNVDDLFEFESVSQSVISDYADLGIDEGCYCAGTLKGGKTIVWRSDDDPYGYDDCLFIYIESELSDAQVTGYAAKLKEESISYDEFKGKYK